MIKSLENIKSIMNRYYLNEIADNNELRAFCKDTIQESDIEQSLQLAIKHEDKDAVEDIFYLGSALNLFTDAIEPLLAILLLAKWHNKHEDIARLFQNHLNKNNGNTTFLLKAVDSIPEYLSEDDFKYSYVRKIIYAIGAQPEPHNMEALESLAKSEDEKIRELALHQIEKRKKSGRWETTKNVQ
ncbi:MAG TPA: hypothetical protein VL443_07050 [Cyclobacteriaceae bacterium]|nr:hypothetical protein [Cyclobacteriaceae bacterium]